MVAGKQRSGHLFGDAERPEAAASLWRAAGTAMDAAEVEFLAEKELVTIIPNFSLDKIYLIGVRARPRHLPRPRRVKPAPGRGRAARAPADVSSSSSLSASRMGSWEEDSACPTRGGLRGGGGSKFRSRMTWGDPRRYPVPSPSASGNRTQVGCQVPYRSRGDVGLPPAAPLPLGLVFGLKLHGAFSLI